MYKDEDAPYSDFRPTEKVDVISGVSSIDGRIICSPQKVGTLNKLLVELQRKCRSIYNKPFLNLHQMYDEANI